MSCACLSWNEGCWYSPWTEDFAFPFRLTPWLNSIRNQQYNQVTQKTYWYLLQYNVSHLFICLQGLAAWISPPFTPYPFFHSRICSLISPSLCFEQCLSVVRTSPNIPKFNFKRLCYATLYICRQTLETHIHTLIHNAAMTINRCILTGIPYGHHLAPILSQNLKCPSYF